MTDKADHIAWAAEAIAVFQRHCRTGDEHAIADLICDLGHLAEERGFDFISEVKRGIGHWYAEHHAEKHNHLGPDAAVARGEIPPGDSTKADKRSRAKIRQCPLLPVRALRG